MAKFTYISARGDTLPLTGGDNYRLVNFDSQTAGAASLSSVIIGGMDGDIINNVQAQPRTIIFDLRIVAKVEETTRKILNTIKLKQKGSIRWEQDNKWLDITGVVESIDMPRWTNAVTMQITMHCEQPFWENIDYIVSRVNEILDAHYFTDVVGDMLYFPPEGIPLGVYETTRTKVVYNDGDVETGIQIEIVATDVVTNPIIYNESGAFFGCGYGDGAKKVVMQSGDTIRINTRKNEKSVTLNGENILSKIKPQSTWLQLNTGGNRYTVASEETEQGNLTFYIMYKQRYI